MKRSDPQSLEARGLIFACESPSHLGRRHPHPASPFAQGEENVPNNDFENRRRYRLPGFFAPEIEDESCSFCWDEQAPSSP